MSVTQIISEHQAVISLLSESCLDDFDRLVSIARQTILSGNTIFFCGNGGSAADSQHLAAELVVRFQTERRALRAAALSTDTSILTACANDYGYDRVFERQVEALVRAGDLLVGLSTSGNSKNIILAVQKAKSLGAKTALMTGQKGGKLAELCDIAIKVPSNITARIQEAHILLGHALCESIDTAIAEADNHV